MIDLVWLIPAFPLLGFVTLICIGRMTGEPASGWLATLAMAGSFLSSLIVFIGMLAEESDNRQQVFTLFDWIPAGDFKVEIGFLADPLSLTMCLFITGVGTLIHLYSIGYMHGDPDFSRFFTYLNLFAFSMLILVLGDNLLLTFLGWEGVGACSYLLISFWFSDPANATAGKKAFLTNRVGDWGFMIAMFLIFFNVGSLQYLEIFELIGSNQIAQTTTTFIVLMLFVGAVGKSAQFPLYLWLPDAMAGPTPVSALIHAATMVTSGVYLLTRVNPIMVEASNWSTGLIAWVGVGTALFAASIAVAQTDIKKVLAYSTVSQLGYMVLAVGCGAYTAAIFHMITHAFFKALLFLGAGSVIHGMNGEQDLRRYGGLRSLMPITAGTFIVGWLAIAGVPPFAGFWSKDEILAFAWEKNPLLWLIGLLTALLTAFYMTRQVILTFFGPPRYLVDVDVDVDVDADADVAHEIQPHESPWTMTFPLVVLALLSVVGGFIQLPFSSSTKWLEHWLEPAMFHNETHLHLSASTLWILAVLALISVGVGIFAGFLTYFKEKIDKKIFEKPILSDAWKFDSAVSNFMGGPGFQAFEATAKFDKRVIDGAVDGTGQMVKRTASVLRLSQNGMVRTYAVGIGLGAVGLLVWFLLRTTI
ncbi:MAG: NADH-quinone oxidoreductase subunit L [Acidimicrobiales bacterium]|nr:NADH-quinone oxidoreductase subunit L [Acidimicrobiales bacterium]